MIQAMRLRTVLRSRLLLAGLMVCWTPALMAAEQAPSAESVSQLLNLMQLQRTIDAVIPQFDQTLDHTLPTRWAGKPLNANQLRIVADEKSRMVALFTASFSPQQLLPLLVPLYQREFSQAEIDQLIAFYQTPLGQKMLAKTPALTQQAMQLGQQRMAVVIPQLSRIARESNAALQAEADPSP